MSIKASSRYMMRELLVNIAWFYGIMLLIYIVGTIFISFTGGGVSGAEFASVIFLFVAGLNAFKEPFGWLMQNGVSRKTMFTARMLTFGATALIMAVLNLVRAMVVDLLPISGMDWSISIFGRSFFVAGYGITGFGAGVLNLLFNFTLLLFVLVLGYFISVMFYRLPGAGKVAVGAGVPVFLTIVLPFADYRFFGGAITRSIWQILAFAMGIGEAGENRPWMPVISFFVAACLFGLFGWLLTRRATVRR